MTRVLITGALGQVGSELVPALRSLYGADLVLATDLRSPTPEHPVWAGPFELLDCTDGEQLRGLLERNRIRAIYHLAAILSARAEAQPELAWRVNMEGLRNVLEVARQAHCQVFVPSSIAAFGPSTPHDPTPQDTIQRPNTLYGVTKVAGELLCDYYAQRFGLDVRGLRYPGLISYTAPPGGGTTDYAVEIFYQALKHGHYTSFLGPDTRLPMMYMPDAVRATLELMQAEPQCLRHRNAFNITAFSCTPAELAAEIQKHRPDFEMHYAIDPVRQTIAESWPYSLDDSAAREEWGWKPRFDLAGMTADMLEKLSERTGSKEA
ncbi:L-threonine 3-dehydrogenase [uncultured Meiothermus sp.]|jgi:nucleoside-diphosphate-sugar epimerase|uniref:L-threonine 3-dehydrogenase n=1 Tax=uncultured Meiothermus sp. TaxID=157471 RepID=UPI0026143367|nr:L-threonine 3-dehydrogenase [uncultured Meiothermus sp.]